MLDYYLNVGTEKFFLDINELKVYLAGALS